MPSLESSLSKIIEVIVPKARHNERLRNELFQHTQDILSSHIGQIREPDIGHLTDIIRRQIADTSTGSSGSLRLSNLLTRLLEQPILSRKHAVLLFLQSLSLSVPVTTPISSTVLASLAPPPPIRSSTHNRRDRDGDVPLSTEENSKAEILREYRARIGKPNISEPLLLRDALYLLQGISGKYAQFVDGNGRKEERDLVFIEDAHYLISVQSKAIMRRVAELGQLYMEVSQFVQEKEGRSNVGTIEQSLCHHLQSQLNDYYRMVAVLESHASSNTSSNEEIKSDIQDRGSGLTLRRLDVWIDDWRLRMRMMSLCVEGAKSVHGGALVSLIHGYTDTGDPFIRSFMDQLLEEVSKPFFSILQQWLFSGELEDPFGEFFVTINPELSHLDYLRPRSDDLTGDGGFGRIRSEDILADTASSAGIRLWEEKYKFKREMLPRFVGETFGRRILSTGKSLNFIRYSCHDSDWVSTRNKLTSAGRILKYGDIAGLEQSIDMAHQIASRRLFEVFFDKFKLLDHLTALKNYLLLGHGDFADQLMETLRPSLSKPANTLYRHNLTATLESAISSTNAQNDPADVLRRLDARMLEYSHGEIGWDVFTLEYKIDPPIDTVISADDMINYMKLFSHIWKMRRVENLLTESWMRIAGASRTFLKLPSLESYWHRVRLIMAEMIHFVRQLQMYTQIEVIAVRWKNLFGFIHKREGDLDSLIQAHRTYVDELVKKTLMINGKPGREDAVLDRIRKVFHSILQFREAMDEFYNLSLAEAARRDQLRDKDRGVYTGPTLNEDNEHLLHTIQRVIDYGTIFSEATQAIIQALQGHTDNDCKDLASRLNFTRYYSQNKDKDQPKSGN